MVTFLRTFIICIVLCVAWSVYAYIEGDIGGNLKVTNEQVYKTVENIKEQFKNAQEPEVIVEPENVEKEMQQDEKKISTPLPVSKNKQMKIYFLNSKSELVWVYREDEGANLETAIKYLLKGATKNERAKGIYSEIPQSVTLLSLKNYEDKIIVDLSSDFVRDGGTTSIMSRIKQLVQTVDHQSDYKKPIYLYINGKKAEYIGGDGVYLKQPLN